MGNKVQAKDIAELPVLRFIEGFGNSPCNWFWGDNPEHYPKSVLHAMPEGTPQKVALAKMRSLIKRGYVDGCKCGCRGDFVLTDKGRTYVRSQNDD